MRETAKAPMIHSQEKAISTLLASAMADAVGNQLEFQSIVTPEDFEQEKSEPCKYITDDTQMSLFLYEALLDKKSSLDGYLRWFKTQTRKKPLRNDVGLLKYQPLYRREAPGVTCMGSMASIVSKRPVVNDSKGNGTVMRATPIAVMGLLNGLSRTQVFMLAREDALLTHKHVAAYQSSVLLCDTLLNLFQDQPLRQSVVSSCAEFPQWEVSAFVANRALDRKQYVAMRTKRCGWVAEEALALAIGANLYAPKQEYWSVIQEACQGVNSDSDTVAAIAGSIFAANHGPGKLGDVRYRSTTLEALPAIMEIEDRLKSQCN